MKVVEHLNEEEKRCAESIAEFKDTMRAGEKNWMKTKNWMMIFLTFHQSRLIFFVRTVFSQGFFG